MRKVAALKAHDLEALAARYRTGASLRQIGAEIGLSHHGVRYRLGKLTAYNDIVTGVLVGRLEAAEAAFRSARTPANRRRLKHSLAMIRRHRPDLHERWRLSGAPELPSPHLRGESWRCDCPDCLGQGSVYTRKVAQSWAWQCASCGSRGTAAARPDLTGSGTADARPSTVR